MLLTCRPEGDDMEKLLPLDMMVILGITLVEHPFLDSRVFQVLDISACIQGALMVVYGSI